MEKGLVVVQSLPQIRFSNEMTNCLYVEYPTSTLDYIVFYNILQPRRLQTQ